MICSICLDDLTNPIATPCGHIFCLECLIPLSQRSPDATKASCPTCRSAFSLVSPKKVFIPEKYRQFIDSNIRRVYLDNSIELTLREKVAQLENRVKSLETQKDLLMGRCESSMAAAVSHAQREKEARTRCATLQKELKQAKRSATERVEETAQRVVRQTAATPPSERRDNINPPTPVSGFRNPYFLEKRMRDFSSPFSTPFGVESRPTIPLPKRRRVTRLTFSTPRA